MSRALLLVEDLKIRAQVLEDSESRLSGRCVLQPMLSKSSATFTFCASDVKAPS